MTALVTHLAGGRGRLPTSVDYGLSEQPLVPGELHCASGQAELHTFNLYTVEAPGRTSQRETIEAAC